MVVSVYEYPSLAVSGLHLIFFLLLGGFLWCLPVGLCSAEMATADGCRDGGIFSWVSAMLGERFGFAAIFFQWFQVTVGFITMIYFILGVLSFAFPFSALNIPWIKLIVVLIIFWGITFLQMSGIKATEKLAKFTFIIGVAIPVFVLFLLIVVYIAAGNPLNVNFASHAFLPDFRQISTLVVFVAFILAFMGIEASSSYINDLENPNRNYPIVMILLVVLSIVLNAIGGLSVAGIVPADQINLSSGVMQAFSALILHFNSGLGAAVKIIAVMLAIGVLGELSGWIVGPVRSMYMAAQKGLLPKAFTRTNQKNVPTLLVLAQGIVVTIWATVLTLGGDGNNLSFLITITLTVVIYLAMYILMFVSYFVLIKRSELHRSYQVPGGKPGKYIFAISGLATSLLAFIISFFPPSSITAGSGNSYIIILGLSSAVTLLGPFAIYSLYGKKHSAPGFEYKHLKHYEQNRFIRPWARGEHRIGNR